MISRSSIERNKRPRLDRFAVGLLSEWRRLKLPVSGETIVVAVSGGADSTALLLALNELTSAGKLSLNLVVAHLDHRLRSTSNHDSQVVSKLAKELGYEITVGRVDVKKTALETGDNLEQAARRARYAFLERAAKRKKSRIVVVAHTMDDQAETVLLRLVRGSASEGLSGMESVRPLRSGSEIELVRPLLSRARRIDTENYCQRKNVTFIVDQMNHDENFARVKIRKQLLPLMEGFNKRIVETIFRTATLLREDSESLGSDAAKLLRLAQEPVGDRKLGHSSLSVDVLAQAPAALRRRALRQWLREARGDLLRLERVHLLGIERLIEGDVGGRVAELPDGTRVIRKRRRLELVVKKVEKPSRNL